MGKMIEINKATSVEFALFKRFAEFLASRDNIYANEDYKKAVIEKKSPKKDPGKKQIFYYYVAKVLLDDYDMDTVENFFAGETIPARVNKESFKFFCERFLKVFNDLKPEQQEYYQDINVEFIRWQKKLYKDNDIELSEDQASDSSFQATVVNFEVTSNDKGKYKGFHSANDIFMKSIDTINEYYDRNQKYLLHENTCYENFKKLFSVRLKNFKKYFPGGEFKRKVMLSTFILARHYWNIYELQGNDIIKQTFSFGSAPLSKGVKSTVEESDFEDRFYGSSCEANCTFGKDKPNKKFSCDVDLMHELLTIEHKSMHRTGSFDTYIRYCFPFGNLFTEKFVGYKLTYCLKEGTVNVCITILEIGNKRLNEKDENNLLYSKVNKHDEAIHPYIKSLLLSPEEYDFLPQLFSLISLSTNFTDTYTMI